MNTIAAVEVEQAQGKTAELLAGVKAMLGGTPNLFRVTAQAPSALESMVAQFGAAAHGRLNAQAREAIALAVSEVNRCDYCLSAHAALATGAHLSPADIRQARDGHATDRKLDALVSFARALVLERGQVGDQALATLRSAGVSDAEVLEVVANVALTTFTNYVNLVAGTEIDFPVVRAGER